MPYTMALKSGFLTKKKTTKTTWNTQKSVEKRNQRQDNLQVNKGKNKNWRYNKERICSTKLNEDVAKNKDNWSRIVTRQGLHGKAKCKER